MPKDESILSGGWLNSRFEHVVEDALDLHKKILFDGLLSSGYLPFETPITPEMVRRMTDDQLQQAMIANDQPGERERLMRMAGFDTAL